MSLVRGLGISDNLGREHRTSLELERGRRCLWRLCLPCWQTTLNDGGSARIIMVHSIGRIVREQYLCMVSFCSPLNTRLFWLLWLIVLSARPIAVHSAGLTVHDICARRQFQDAALLTCLGHYLGDWRLCRRFYISTIINLK